MPDRDLPAAAAAPGGISSWHARGRGAHWQASTLSCECQRLLEGPGPGTLHHPQLAPCSFQYTSSTPPGFTTEISVRLKLKLNEHDKSPSVVFQFVIVVQFKFESSVPRARSPLGVFHGRPPFDRQPARLSDRGPPQLGDTRSRTVSVLEAAGGKLRVAQGGTDTARDSEGRGPAPGARWHRVSRARQNSGRGSQGACGHSGSVPISACQRAQLEPEVDSDATLPTCWRFKSPVAQHSCSGVFPRRLRRAEHRPKAPDEPPVGWGHFLHLPAIESSGWPHL
jgi:hypothetical protein